MWIWFVPAQAAVAFTVLAVTAGGQVFCAPVTYRGGLGDALPLLVSLKPV